MQADRIDKQIFEHKMAIIESKLVESHFYAVKIHGERVADELFYDLAIALSAYRRIPENETAK